MLERGRSAIALFFCMTAALPALAGEARAKRPASPPYASTQPLTEPAIFGEGVISGGYFDSHPAFTPDGATLYFVRSAANFNFWAIMVSRFSHGRWSEPEVAPFSGQYADADPFITADGARLYFISRRPLAVGGTPRDNTDIWMMRKAAAGSWGKPQHLDAPINSDGDEWYPTLTRDGTLYFGSDRPGGLGKTDLYRARPDGDGYAPAENLGSPVNTEADEYEPYIAPDESYLIFMASGRSDSLGRSDLYISYRRDGAWSAPQNLGKRINSSALEYSPKVSPDGRYFFWSSTRNITDRPLAKPLNSAQLKHLLGSAGNGMGDIYQIDIGEVLKPERPGK